MPKIETRYLFIYRTTSGIFWRKVEEKVFKSVQPQAARYDIFSVGDEFTPLWTYHIKSPPNWIASDVENILKTQIHPTGTSGPVWL